MVTSKDVSEFAEEIATGSVLIVVVLCLAAPAYGVYHWLRYGAWGAISVRQSLDYFGYELIRPESSWAGISKIIDYVDAANVGWAVLAMACLFYWALIGIASATRPVEPRA